jgi:hypothetical protein
MTTSNEIKKFTLVIPFANTSGRNNAKKLGAIWNPSKKVWEVSTTEAKMSQRNLWKFVSEEKVEILHGRVLHALNSKVVERGFPGCAKHGFDHIEKMG